MRKKLSFLKHNKKFIITVIALLEAVILMYTMTFAWIEGSKSADVDNYNCEVSAGPGLEFTGADIENGTLTLPDVTLEDCSSVDGRNFFFPTVGNLTDSGVVSFRSGTDADKNKKYISTDFNVTALPISDDPTQEIKVYLDSESSVTSDTITDLSAVRISFNFNDGTQPVLLCPSLETSTITRAVNAVGGVDAAGAMQTSSSVAASIPKYYYGGSPLITLKQSETKHVTVSIWLEGTDPSCTSDILALKDLKINLKLTTTSNGKKIITFVDYSPSKWIANGSRDYTMYAVGSNGIDYTMVLQSGGDSRTFTTSIPEGVSNVTFARKNNTTGNIESTWATDANMSDSDINTYYAIGQGALVDGANYGYWVSSACTGVIDVYFTDNGDTLATSSAKPFIHAYASAHYGDEEGKLKSWPGFQMCYAGTDDNGNKVYHMIIPGDIGRLIFNNNSGKQTGYIEVPDCSSSTGITKIGYYLLNTITLETNPWRIAPGDEWPKE